MTIENLKQIAIKYATTKGSRVPLAPDELCNAVVQYFNEFLKITADINTIQVAVTEEGGNIVFTITGNTLDGKAFTPIVITVDHNDFVTNQEFEEFKTSVTKQLNNKRSVISSPASSYVVYTQANGLESNLPYSELANQTSTNIMARRANGTSDVKKGISGENVANMENIDEINSTLDNKLDKVVGSSNFNRLYKISDSGEQGVVNYSDEAYASTIVLRDGLGAINIAKGSNKLNAANMENIADVEAKIPAYTTVDSVSYDTTNGAIIAYNGANEIHIPLLAGENVTIDASEDNKKIVISAAGGGGTGDVTAAGNNTFTGENTFKNDTNISGNIWDTSYIYFVDTKDDYMTNGYTTTIKNGGFDIAFYKDGMAEYYTTYADNGIINKDIDMEGEVSIKFPKKEGTFALISDIPDTSSFLTRAGDNTFDGTNTFNNSIYAKNGVVAGDTTNYGANSVTKGSNTYSFPNKSGTFAMTTDVIKDPIYFISFYANEPSEPCHLVGTMMTKNSYGTGQKTNEEFAVMLADNFYTNNNEGLAVSGKIAEKDILCLYSDDGLAIRYLDAENSEFELPTAMFFVKETEI